MRVQSISKQVGVCFAALKGIAIGALELDVADLRSVDLQRLGRETLHEQVICGAGRGLSSRVEQACYVCGASK